MTIESILTHLMEIVQDQDGRFYNRYQPLLNSEIEVESELLSGLRGEILNLDKTGQLLDVRE